MKTILISDIHGCLNTFKTLLNKCDLNTKEDKLILLGDYIDRGDNSFEVLEYIMELKEKMKDNLIILRGNHDNRLISNHINLIDELIWIISGKINTIKSFKNNNKKINYFSDWIKENTNIYYDGELFNCAHASIKYEDIKNNSIYTLTSSRFNTKLNKYKSKLTITGHISLKEPTYYPGNSKKRILEYDKYIDLPSSGIICIDTCGYKNKLTAMIIEDNKFVLKYVKGKKN